MSVIGRIFKPKLTLVRYLIAVVCATALLTGNTVFPAHAALRLSSTDTVKIPVDQLDSLVAPIALYPDSLLSQTLVASTYPLEIIQLQQWLDRNLVGINCKMLFRRQSFCRARIDTADLPESDECGVYEC